MGCLPKFRVPLLLRFLSTAPAVLAYAKQRHVIHIDGEPMLLLYRFKQDLQQVVLTFRYASADAADQMVMRLIVRNFVVHLPAPIQRVNQAHLAQEIERAINRGTADGGILPVYPRIHVIRRDVIVRLLHRGQDQLALRRQAVAEGMQLGGKIGGRWNHTNLDAEVLLQIVSIRLYHKKREPGAATLN